MSDKPKYDYSDYYYGKYKKLFRSGYFEEDDKQKESKDNESFLNQKDLHTIIDIRNNNTDENYTKKKKSRSILFAVCILIMCVSILFLSVELFSPRGIVGELKTVFGITKDADCTSYYAISMGTFDNVQDARQLADAIRSRGGAGYIVHSDTYNVLASCYLKEEEAKRIADLNTAKVFVIRVFEKNKKDFPQKLREKFVQTVGYEKIVYDKLYKISNDLDEGTINEGEAVQKIIELKSDIKERTNPFLESSVNYADEYIQEFRVGIIACNAALNNLSNMSLTRPNLICDIRYTYLMVLNLAK